MQQIRNTEQLRRTLLDGEREFELTLRFGGCSRKSIRLLADGRFQVVNHIDETVQKLTDRGLYTESNIGHAMKMGAFVLTTSEFSMDLPPKQDMNNECQNENEAVDKMPNGVPKADHYFIRACLGNDEASSDEELQVHFVSQGVLPEHAAQYIKNRTRYMNDFFVNDDGTRRWPLKSKKDMEKVMELEDRYY